MEARGKCCDQLVEKTTLVFLSRVCEIVDLVCLRKHFRPSEIDAPGQCGPFGVSVLEESRISHVVARRFPGSSRHRLGWSASRTSGHQEELLTWAWNGPVIWEAYFIDCIPPFFFRFVSIARFQKFLLLLR